MYLIAIAWMYTVVILAAAEWMAPNGTGLGAFFTLVLYGVLPLSVVLYIFGTPARRRARLKLEQAQQAQVTPEAQVSPDAPATGLQSPSAPRMTEASTPPLGPHQS